MIIYGSITDPKWMGHSKLFKNISFGWFWTGLGGFIDARKTLEVDQNNQRIWMYW